MIDQEKQQALENIALIKDMVTESRQELHYTGGGWIAIIWGLYSLLGYAGQRLFALAKLYDWEGLWWVALSVPAFFLSVLVIRNRAKTQSVKLRRTLCVSLAIMSPVTAKLKCPLLGGGHEGDYYLEQA